MTSQRRALAISPDDERLRRLAGALEAAGTMVTAVHHIDDVRAEVIPFSFVFFAWDGDVDSLRELLPRLRPRAHVTCIVPDANLATYTELLLDSRVNHVVAGDDFADDVNIIASKLVSGDIFGVEKYTPPGCEVNYIRLRDFKGRSRAIDTVLAFAEKSGIRRKVRAAVAQVCEELLMNALYDAPVDENGNPIFAEVDPHDRTESKSPKPVSIRYVATPKYFAVAVRDRFGRLDKDTLLAYIRKCLLSSQQIDRKAYGAGLGLYLVANSAAGYVVNVAPGMATEVICTFNLGATTPLRLLGVFVHPGTAALHE